MDDKSQVCITIDTEFSVAGAFAAPHERKPVGEPIVLCQVNGSEQGLGFLLRTFEDFGIRATFFVEALNYFYFGDGPMASIATRILQAGHDIQLHVHPCWSYFRDPNWLDRLATSPPNDSCVGRTKHELAELFELGVSAFGRWGLPRPVAVRTGSLQSDAAVYRAARDVGLKISSSVGLGGPTPPNDPTLRISAGRRRVHGVLEVPVLSYKEVAFGTLERYHLFTVTGTSFREAEHLLWSARRAAISPVVLLTHPFEYAKSAGPAFDRLRVNRVNQERLRRLCQFLNRHSADFTTTTFADSAPSWLAAAELSPPTLRVPVTAVVGRLIENKFNDWIWTY